MKSRTPGHVSPTPGTNQRLQEGVTLGAPQPRPARLERNAFFVPLSVLGEPQNPGAPTAAGVSRPADSLPSPLPLPRGRALDSIWARQGG